MFGTCSVFWFDLENDIFQVKSLLLATAIVTITKRELNNSSMSTSRRTGACTVFELHHKSHRGTLRSPKSWNHWNCRVSRGDDSCLPLDQCPWHRSRGPSPEPKFSMGFLSMLCRKHHLCTSRDSGICGIWMGQYIPLCPYARMPKKYCKRSVVGHLMLPSSPCPFLFHIGQHCGCRIWTTPGI